MSAMEQIPQQGKRFEKTVYFDLVDFEHLNEEEKAAVSAAMQAQKSSEHTEVRAGAAAVGYDGEMTIAHNVIPKLENEPGHAEQRAITELYRQQIGREQKLKILAVAACMDGQEVVRHSEPYDYASVKEEDIDVGLPCPACLDFIHNRIATLNPEEEEHLEVLAVTATGQIYRTTFRSLLTKAWKSVKVGINPHRGGPTKESFGK